jgi:CBS domain-containing protein
VRPRTYPARAGAHTGTPSTREHRLRESDTCLVGTHEGREVDQRPRDEEAPMRAQDLMTPHPVTCDPQTPIIDAARLMRDHDIGDVLVGTDRELRGIVTDRDIVVRGLAESADPTTLSLGDLCSDQLVTARADAEIGEVSRLMEEHALRRIPVVDGSRAVGIISIGDLAAHRDPDSVLGEISTAPPDS